MPWKITIVDEVSAWLHELRSTDKETLRLISAAIDCLVDQGPNLGRPLADSITGSKIRNLKELRPGSAGTTEIRMLFVFDRDRQAVILVAGDKAGNWKSWYQEAIPLAEQRYDKHLASPED